MKELLIAEMKRAIELMENEKTKQYTPESAELRDINKLIRKHSILLEKEMYPTYQYYNN